MADTTLFFSVQPTRSSRARWAMLEAAIPFASKPLDLFTGDQRQPSFLEVNPLGFVPAMVVDGEPMIESAAIALWAAMQAPERALLPEPATPQLRTCLQWVVHGPAELDRLFAVLNVHTRFRAPDERDPRVVDETLRSWTSRAERLSAALDEGPWLLGSDFSVADVVIGHSIVWARMLDRLADHPPLLDYLSRLEARPAFREVYGGPIQTFPDPHAA